MHTIKSVGVLSVAKIMGVLYFALGLIFVPIFLLAGAGMMAAGREATFSGIMGLVLAIMMPVLYGGMGFVMGAIMAFLYNLVAKWLGGIEVQVQAPPTMASSLVG